MEFDGSRYLQFYGFDLNTSREEFTEGILAIYAREKHTLVQLIKNLILIRLLQIAEKLNGLRKYPVGLEISLYKVFKKRILWRIAEQLELGFPKLYMSGVSSLILLGVTFLWIVFLITIILSALFNNVELLFTGIDITMLLSPLWVTILFLPTGLALIFKNFFALGTVDGIKTLSDLVNKIFELNYKELRENNFSMVVDQLVHIQQTVVDSEK